MHYESLSEELSERSLLDLLLFLDFFSFLLFFSLALGVGVKEDAAPHLCKQ